MNKYAVDNLTDTSFFDDLINTTDLQSLIQGYLLSCQCEGRASSTMTTYKCVLSKFEWFCNQNNFPPIQKMTVMHIRKFLWYLTNETNRWDSKHPTTKKQASRVTVHTYYRVLKPFFGWLKREQLIYDNPFDLITVQRAKSKVVEALSTSEIQRLFSVCRKNRDKAILSLFLDTGMRVGELASLSINDVDLNSGSIVIRHGKGGKQRIVHVGTKAQRNLWRYIALNRKTRSDQLFVNRSSELLTADGIKQMIKRLGQQAGVRVHCHKLRHTFAISYLRNGGDVFSLKYLLGHANLNMTQTYLQSLNAEDAINAHKKFSPLDNLR
jgi:site-specific recombinase XerD